MDPVDPVALSEPEVLPDADPENVESVELLLDGFACVLEVVFDGEVLVVP